MVGGGRWHINGGSFARQLQEIKYCFSREISDFFFFSVLSLIHYETITRQVLVLLRDICTIYLGHA